MAYQPCKFLGVQPGMRITKRHVFSCNYVVPEATLPISITTAYGYSRDMRRRHVGKEDCAKCPCFTKREAAQ